MYGGGAGGLSSSSSLSGLLSTKLHVKIYTISYPQTNVLCCRVLRLGAVYFGECFTIVSGSSFSRGTRLDASLILPSSVD